MDSYKRDLLRGRITVDSEPTSNIVRVFMSSTFSDMSEERNILFNEAYPEIRNFCSSRGIEFQVIDMRWGVREAAVVDHSIASLCLAEIRECRKVSIGPYFVVLFGNRYGYQPLPSTISETEYTILKNIAEKEQMDPQGLLDTWYRLDMNNIPSVRVLEPIISHFLHYDEPRAEFSDKREEERAKWNGIYADLFRILKNASNMASKNGSLPKEVKKKFSKSITHMEIDEALLIHEGGRFLAYNRDITDIQRFTNHPLAGTYFDLNGNQYQDQEEKTRQKMLNSMKKSVLRDQFIKKSFKKYHVAWRDIENGNSGNYLRSLCHDFTTDMKKRIAACLKQRERKRQSVANGDALLEEVIHHARFQYAKLTNFCGRDKLIDSIIATLEQSQNTQPIVISGQSGCGKTALMAKIIEVSKLRFPEAVIIYRFLGTSPECSSIHELLKSLISQISRIIEIAVPAVHLLQNFTDVSDHFGVLLQKLSSLWTGEEKLLLFLDSIDQLSVEDGAHRMTWLPKTTPSRVTIVISTLPEPDFDVVPAMKKHIPEANCFNVDHLTTDTAKVIMEKCLSSESRRLTAAQTSMILEAFKKSPYPLFLKLMMEEAKRWKSHFDITGFIPPDSSREAIAMFYERLENEHGKVIVSHALGYIVAARDGITENEMLDLLSLDNEVLHEAYEHWSPPTTDTVRVPSFSWTRLYYDLSKYLVRRQAGNHTVLALYHRQFIEVAREKYLRCSAAFTIYSIMKEYFLGTYSNEFTKFLKLKMWNSEKQVNRRVANQPLRFSSNVFNNRKLRELPYCLLKGTFLKELKTNVFADPNWILMKSAAFSIKEVIEDYNMYLSTNQDIEIALIRDAIKLAKPTLEFPGARNHFCVELYCRLKFFEQRFPRFLGSLVNKSLNILEETPSEMIVPRNSSFQSPGGPLRATITGLKTPVTCLKFSNQLDIFAGGSKDGCILIWDCENDEALQRIEASASAIVAIAFSESGDKLASASEDGEVRIFNIETGNQCFQVSTNGITNAKIMISGHNVYVVGDRKVVSWNFLDNTKTFKKQIDTKVTCSMVQTEEKIALILVGKIDGTCLSINAKTGEESSLTEVCHSPMIDIFKSTIQGHIILVWENGQVSLVDGATLSCKYSVTVGKPEIKQCSLCESGRALTLATARDVILCTIIDDKFKHEQIRKISFIRDNIVAVAYEDRRVMLWDISQEANPKAVATWDGTGAPIDYMEFGKNIGVTASCKVFYLKVWDIDEDDEIQLAPSLPLRHNSSTLSNNGQYLAYEENGSLVTRKTTDFVSDERSVSSCPIRADNDDVAVKALRFAGSNMIILFDSGLLQKLSRKIENKDGLLTYFIGDSLKLPIECTTYLTLSVTENGEMAMVLMTDVNQNHIFYFVNISTFLQVSKIILGTDDSTGRISALTITDTACTKVFAGTTTGKLLSLEFDFHDNSGRAVSSQSKHGSEITCLVISFSGKYLFSGSTGRKRRLWELNGSSFLMKHELHFESLLESGVTAAQFSHDDEYLITGSKERSITVWNSHTGDFHHFDLN